MHIWRCRNHGKDQGLLGHDSVRTVFGVVHSYGVVTSNGGQMRGVLLLGAINLRAESFRGALIGVIKMILSRRRDRQTHFLAGLFLVLCVLSGCAMVGPKSISTGRAGYNEVINRTEDEQILLSIVKGRYGETSSLLAVKSVAANVRFSTNARIEAGFGPQDISGENLFIGGLAYEENPTITYSPVQGEDYIRQMMSPIPLDILLLGVRAMSSSDDLFILYVNRINDLRNPDFLAATGNAGPGFKRFVELFTELHTVGVLDLAGDPQEKMQFSVVISKYAPHYTQKVMEFLALLALPYPPDEPHDIIIPVHFALKTGQEWGIGITTRSTLNMIEILRASVIVPPEHDRLGLSLRFPPMGLPGQGIRIISSTDRPENTSVAVKYRGYWFYIDETDQRTKAFFRALRLCWSMTIAGSADQMMAPILTIPVSR